MAILRDLPTTNFHGACGRTWSPDPDNCKRNKIDKEINVEYLSVTNLYEERKMSEKNQQK